MTELLQDLPLVWFRSVPGKSDLWPGLGICLHSGRVKIDTAVCVCVCVCVREREREREWGVIMKDPESHEYTIVIAYLKL